MFSPWLPSVSPAALLAVVLVSGAGLLGVGGSVSHFLRRDQQDVAAPLGFAALGRRGCPGCGLAVVLHRVAVSRAPAQFSSTQK